ncbi:hypothetical protein V6N13_073293 [Hibiscus sabdariffa]|uniref:Transmembrane protein n=1 Tax=Hibiscus sabdariffa TaxID=183260 RepID=A0ABR2E8N9_9ROSI
MFFGESARTENSLHTYLLNIPVFCIVMFALLTLESNAQKVVALIDIWGQGPTNLINNLEFVDKSTEKLCVTFVINQNISSVIVGSCGLRKLNFLMMLLV